MPDDQKIHNNSKIKITNIEKILPKIEQKLVGREKEQAECASIKRRIPELKKDFINAEAKYIELRNEISQISRKAMNLYLQIEPSPFVRFHKRIQQIWRFSKTGFFIILVLLAILAAYTIATFYYQNSRMQTLSFGIGFALIGLIVLIGLPKKYVYLTGAFFFSTLVFLATNFVSDGALKWVLISAGISIIGLGLAVQTFTSGEVIEQKLNDILKRLPESPTTENHQPQSIDVVQKPEQKK